jgi:melanoma-associated antigen
MTLSSGPQSFHTLSYNRHNWRNVPGRVGLRLTRGGDGGTLWWWALLSIAPTVTDDSRVPNPCSLLVDQTTSLTHHPAMPRQLKRRSDAISRNEDDSNEEPQPTARRQRQRSSSSDHAPAPATQRRRRQSTSTQDSDDASSRDSAGPEVLRATEANLIKKLVRLALATEYSRTPLRRTEISAKILKDANTTGGRASFQKVFDGAQEILGDTFGMQLMELPSRDKTTLKDRRAQATQTKVSNNTSSRSWILVSTLPKELKTNPDLVQPTAAPDEDSETEYTALYTFVLSLIYLNSSSITDQKLERYLRRVNADIQTPLGMKDKLLQRMMKEGYIDKRRDTSGGEELIEWVPGPRGKVEVGVEGVMGLVKTVYGYGAVELARDEQSPRRHRDRSGIDNSDEDDDETRDPAPGRLVKIEEDELNSRLARSLGIRVGQDGKDAAAPRRQNGAEPDARRSDEDDEQPGPSRRGRPRNSGGNTGRSQAQQDQGRRRGRPRQQAQNDEDDDDDDSE